MNDSYRLWSLWGMLRSYLPLYQIALRLGELRSRTEVFRGSKTPIFEHHATDFDGLVEEIRRECLEHGLTHTSGLAKSIAGRSAPGDYSEMFSTLIHLNDSLNNELEKEAVFRISPERKDYFEQGELFGPGVAAAFPSCARDIEEAGSCFALEQEDACVHHLMLVLERGLHALADKVGVPYQPDAWQKIIDAITGKLNTLPHSHPERAFYREVNAQFGFLKIAYRNHSEHAHDDPYDMSKALSILNHVRGFMQELEKGGLSRI